MWRFERAGLYSLWCEFKRYIYCKKISKLGKLSLKDLQKVLDGKVVKDSVFVTDSLRPYQKLSLDMSLSHICMSRGKRAVGTFNIQTVNNYHKRLKDLIFAVFKCVATKYLNNYL